jgi:hypothetical protein
MIAGLILELIGIKEVTTKLLARYSMIFLIFPTSIPFKAHFLGIKKMGILRLLLINPMITGKWDKRC